MADENYPHFVVSLSGLKENKIVRLCFVICCVALLAFMVFVALHTSLRPEVSHKETSKVEINNSTTCSSSKCADIAARIRSDMNFNVNPCDDFFQFACGNYGKKRTIPEGSTNISKHADEIVTLYRNIHNLFEADLTSNLTLFHLMKTHYHLCLNTSRIEEQGLVDFNHFLNKLGGWPVLMGNSYVDFKPWQEIIYLIRQEGLPYNLFIFFGPVPITSKSNKNKLQLGPPTEFGIPAETLIKGRQDIRVTEYLQYMVDIAVIFGADEIFAFSEMEKVLNFEIQLAKMTLTPHGKSNFTGPKSAEDILNTIMAEFTFFNWKKFLDYVLFPWKSYEDEEVITVVEPNTIRNTLKLVNSTEPRVVVNYVIWTAVRYSSRYLTEPLRDRTFAFEYGSNKLQEPRWLMCSKRMSNHFLAGITALYVRSDTFYKMKNIANDVKRLILQELQSIIKKADWMTEDTKRRTLKRKDEMNFYIAYANELYEDSLLESHYESLKGAAEGENEPTTFLQSVLSMNRFEFNKELANLRVHYELTTIKEDNFCGIDIHYIDSKNEIVIPIGFLKGRLFHQKGLKFLDYGEIGYRIAFSIADGIIRKFRNREREEQPRWWDKKTSLSYFEKSKCLLKHYTHTINKTQDRNAIIYLRQNEHKLILDNAGFKAAYLAYNYWQHNISEANLPGLEYSNHQMFWIVAANNWCMRMNSKNSEEFNPYKARLNGAVANLQEFSKAFECSKGTNMNPKEKCPIW